MAGFIENVSLPSQPFSDAHASTLDYFFPGFTRLSAAVQEYLTIDLNVYVPLLCLLGLIMFGCEHIAKYLLGLLKTHYISTIHLRYQDEAYDMTMIWISSQSFTRNVRSLLATTVLLASNRSRTDSSNSGAVEKKILYYTPWNGQFFMWYKGYILMFRREYLAGELRSREEVSISCFGRSPQILRTLLSECNAEYTKLIRDKTCLYRHVDHAWVRFKVSDIRLTSTVILDEGKKAELLDDIKNFLDPASQQWCLNRGIPYRRGYLLYGPPGTGKSSLSLSIAGCFGLDICILNLSAITEATMESLFAKLPSHCVILLEDIDAVTSKRSEDAGTDDSRQVATSSPSREIKSSKVSLSALLNIIDGVGSHEGRVLIMTTNHITHLDEALIRPGRVDKKVELGLADKKMTAEIFSLIFKPVEGDAILPGDAQSDGLVGGDGQVPEAVGSWNEEANLERLAEEFAVKVPELEFSPAEIQSFLLVNKQSPGIAVANVDQWMTKITEERKKMRTKQQVTPKSTEPAGISNGVKPGVLGDALPETSQASKPLQIQEYIFNSL